MLTVHVVVQLGIEVLLAFSHRVVTVLGHCQDLSGPWFNGHDRVPRTRWVTNRNTFLHGAIGSLLHVPVEGRLDRQTTSGQDVSALFFSLTENRVVLDDSLHVVAEVRSVLSGSTPVWCVVDLQAKVSFDSFVVFFLRNVLVLEHLPQHDVSAL